MLEIVKTRLFIVLVILSFSSYSFAEEYNLIESIGKDFGEILSYPVNIKLDDLAVIFPAGIITAALFNNDLLIKEEFNKSSNLSLDTLSHVDMLGNGVFNLAICGGMYTLGGKKERLVGVQIFESFIETGVLVTTIKYLTGRSRPWTGNGPYAFSGPTLSDDSFPSGHTAIAFSTATVFADAYGCWYIAYPLATLVGLSRIYTDAHWSSDVFVAALIGCFIGKMHNIDYDKNKEVIGYKFNYENNGIGCKLVAQF